MRIIGALMAVSLCGWTSTASAADGAQGKQPRNRGAKVRAGGTPKHGSVEPESSGNADPSADPDSWKLFAALDLDRDGRVSRQELERSVERHISRRVALRFSQLDRNRDGRVTRREVVSMRADRFSRFDLDRDGAFTRAELDTVMIREATDRLRRLLASLDTDGDRVCSYAELSRHRQERIAARQRKQSEAKVVATEKPRKERRAEDHAASRTPETGRARTAF